MEKKDHFYRGVIGVVLGICLVYSVHSQCWAGQIVTPELHRWAREAIRQEKALKGLKEKNTISVLYFLSKGDKPVLRPLQKGLPIMLITDLAKLEKFQVVDRVHLQAIIDELNLSQTGLVEETTRLKLGKILKARWIVGGELVMPGEDQLQILSYLLDTPREKTLGHPGVEGVIEQLIKLEKDLLFKIVALLNIKLTEKQIEELEKPVTVNFNALYAYFKGIDASDGGRYEEAAKHYEEAQQLDPAFQWPKTALLELIDLKLIQRRGPRKRRTRELVRSLRNSTSLTDTLKPEAPTKRIKKPGQVPVVKREEPGSGGETPLGGTTGRDGAGGGATGSLGYTTGP